jgi:3',5'-cyclic AMP phosphodiesterase CpdA
MQNLKRLVCIAVLLCLQNQILIAAGSDYEKLHKEQSEYFENITEKQAPAISFELVDEPLFTFALIADSHIGNRGRLESNAMDYRLIEAWRQINGFMPVFTLHLGDMTTGWPQRGDHQGELEYARYIDDTYSLTPVHYTPGNHDVGNKRSQSFHGETEEEDFGITSEKLRLYRRRFGADYYSFHHKGYRFICINTQLFNSDMKENELQWQWLEEELRAAQDDKGIFVFTHYPLFLNSPETDPGPENYEVIDRPARSRLLQLFMDGGVDMVYTGHTHWPVHNYAEDIEFHTIYSPTFARVFFERNLTRRFYDVQGGWRFNPYKVGYSVARVYPDRTVTQFVQSYPRMPKTGIFQLNNSNEVRRILPKSSSELRCSNIGVFIDIPEISKERRLADRSPSALDDSWISAGKDKKDLAEGPVAAARDYTISTPIELSARQGVKRMFINQPFTPGQLTPKQQEELTRLLKYGVPRGVELILPLSLDTQSAQDLNLSGFAGKIAGYRLLWHRPDGSLHSQSQYERLLHLVRGRIEQQAKGSVLVSGAVQIGSDKQVDEFLVSELVKYVDEVLFTADIDTVTESDYRRVVEKIHKSVSDDCRIGIHLTGSKKSDSPLETVSTEKAKLMQRIFKFNYDKNIYSVVSARTHSSLSVLNNDYDPTFLYYGIASFNTVTGSELEKIKAGDVPVRLSSGNVECDVYENGNNDIYICLWQNGSSESPEYVDIDTDYLAESAFYIDPLTATLQRLNISDNSGAVIKNIRVADYPVFVRLKSEL